MSVLGETDSPTHRSLFPTPNHALLGLFTPVISDNWFGTTEASFFGEPVWTKFLRLDTIHSTLFLGIAFTTAVKFSRTLFGLPAALGNTYFNRRATEAFPIGIVKRV